MVVTETRLKGCFIIQPQVFKDARGYFLESFNKEKFKKETGLDINFVQDNESQSSKGVLRGLHYQTGDYAQAKLIRVVKGSVLDVVVDLRKESNTFGEHFSIELTQDNKTQLFVPKSFAHGFLVLEDETIFNYKCDNYYNPDSEDGIIYNDPTLNIRWNMPKDQLLLSKKDEQLQTLEDFLK